MKVSPKQLLEAFKKRYEGKLYSENIASIDDEGYRITGKKELALEDSVLKVLKDEFAIQKDFVMVMQNNINSVIFKFFGSVNETDCLTASFKLILKVKRDKVTKTCSRTIQEVIYQPFYKKSALVKESRRWGELCYKDDKPTETAEYFGEVSTWPFEEELEILY